MGRNVVETIVGALVLVVAAAGVMAGTVWMTSRHHATASPSSSTSPTAAHSPPRGADALEDGVLMGCDAQQIKAALHELIDGLALPHATEK